MKLRHMLFVVILATLLGLAAKTARAEEVIEAWRSPYGEVRSVSVNPTDGSVWVASGALVLHLAADGTILGQISGSSRAKSVSVNPTDGSCWVGGYGCWDEGLQRQAATVVHLAEDGTELLRVEGLSGECELSVNPTDGSCWVAAWDELVHLAGDGTEIWRADEINAKNVAVNPVDGSCWAAIVQEEYLVHLAADGTELWRGQFRQPHGLAVNPTDGSCWVADADALVHVAEDGAELWRGSETGWGGVSVNPTDGSCWFVTSHRIDDVRQYYVVHVAEDGTELWRGEGLRAADIGLNSLAANPADGSCWVGGEGQILHLHADGTELWRGESFTRPRDISVNSTDGSCWVLTRTELTHLAEDGTELWGAWPFDGHLCSGWCGLSLAANPTDGSCWVADGDLGQIVHLAEDGAELWQGTAAGRLSINATDGSCWVAAGDEVIHLSADGTEVWRGGGFDPGSNGIRIAVDPTDGSCWVSEEGSHQVVHLSEDGVELHRISLGTYFGPTAIAVNPTDGSCWVAAWGGGLVHLAQNGAELWRRDDIEAYHLAVSAADGCCWALGTELIRLAANGAELWRGSRFDGPWYCGLSANSADGSCWVSDYGNGQVAHFVIPGWEAPAFPDVPFGFWAFDGVEACADAGIVGGYGDGLYHPDWTLSRDQMAVFISRSIATPTGEMSLDDYVPPTTPSFSDVPTDFWCYKYIEYAVEHDLVGGYGDGTYQPQVTIDRGQMAVFIARAMAGDDQSVPDPTGDPSFPDVPADFWSYRHIEYIAAEEVAGGYYDGLYHPENLVSRDQMAVFICRAFDLPT